MTMIVKAAADAAGVSPKAVRLWESKGLLPQAERTDAGYRLFTNDDITVLRFIRQAKALDLTLTEIKDILDLQRHGATPCGQVTALLDAHITEIDRKLGDLRAMRRTLVEAGRAARASQRRGEDAAICQIIETARAPH
jgi:MerR family copper efflux transcriptional regulator